MFAGKVGAYRGERQLAHPDYELFSDEDALAQNSEEWAKRPIPLYPATSRLASWQIAKSMGVVLDVLEDLVDPIPEDIRATEELLGFSRGTAEDSPTRGGVRLEGSQGHPALS